MNELSQLTALCERLGAPPEQAATMASQLAKRAGQLADERGMSRDEAEALVAAAHQVCPYSNATRGNVNVGLKLA